MYIFTHQRHLDGGAWVTQFDDKFLPARHVTGVVSQGKNVQHLTTQSFAFKRQGDGIDAVGIEGLNHSIGTNPTESTDLSSEVISDRSVSAANQHIRLDANGAQLLHRVLGGFGFEFS